MMPRDSFGQIPLVVRRSRFARARLSAVAALVIGASACGSPKGQVGGETGGAGVGGLGGGGNPSNGNTGGTGIGFQVGTTGGAEESTGGSTQAATTLPPPVCGNGALEAGEACDDSNPDSGDGCTADCSAIEPNYACPVPGQACVLTVVCGDKKITGTETCDDGDTDSGDGCSDVCQLEHGWVCPVVGAACRAGECGDSVIAGGETCDDGNSKSGDGCSSVCQPEVGWLCTTAGQACTQTTCGDGVPEGSEECDDGNLIPYDGCSPTCAIEPSCANGSCTAVCGDGLKFPQEGCDDGNTRSGDGCSADCKEESGYKCEDSAQAAPKSLVIPVLFRDFLYMGTPAQSGHPAGHPDFENPEYAPPASCRASTGLVAAQLGDDGKPVFASSVGIPATTCPTEITSADTFKSWYHDDPLNIVVAGSLTLSQAGTNTYAFDSATDQAYRGLGGFFPLNGLGWQTAKYCSGASPTTDECQTNVPTPNTAQTPPWCAQWATTTLATDCDSYGTPRNSGNNFSFTSELRYPFTYRGGEVFSFTGDDDVWAFVNGTLAVDLGGIHQASSDSITLDDAAADAFDLQVGGMYEIVLFQAERHVSQSNYKLTLAGFDHTSSTCHSVCGDGILTPDEACDLGKDYNTGEYGTCNPDCTLAPMCGDGKVDEAQGEQCDDVVNLATYGFNGNSKACDPNCHYAPYCGDGTIDSLFGEQCDDKNDVAGDGCEPNCLIGALCGNGKLDPDEECDDGNIRSGDGCSQFCRNEPPPIG